MALYSDDDAFGLDVKSANALASVLSGCTAYQSLTGVGQSAALDTIVVGPGEPPWDGEAFTEEELAQRHCWANIFSPGDGGASVFLGEGVDELNQQGVCLLEVHWVPAAAHKNETNGGQDCYRFFWDRTGALKNQIWSGAYATDNQCPRVQQIDELGFGWNTEDREAAEGAMLSCGFRVMWGDLGQ